MAKRVFDHFRYFGHPFENGHRPFGGENGNPAAGVQLVQPAVERLGHDAVADPAGGDDQDFFAHGVARGGGSGKDARLKGGFRRASGRRGHGINGGL